MIVAIVKINIIFITLKILLFLLSKKNICSSVIKFIFKRSQINRNKNNNPPPFHHIENLRVKQGFTEYHS
jgi:hypothetical protein